MNFLSDRCSGDSTRDIFHLAFFTGWFFKRGRLSLAKVDREFFGGGSGVLELECGSVEVDGSVIWLRVLGRIEN